jgi:signal transduction histidine kinase
MEGDLLHLVAGYNFGTAQRQLLGSEYPMRPSRGYASGRAILSRSTVQIPDTDADKGYRGPQSGFRSLLAAPLLKGDQAIGSIVIYKAEPGTFPLRQVALLQSFAAQAVIAIENARLFNETQEALERQTATAEILKVIASSPSDVQPVFQAIADRSKQLVNGFATAVLSIVDDVVYLAAFTPTTAEADAGLQGYYPRPLSASNYAEAIRRGETHRIVDTETELTAQPDILKLTRQRGWRSALFVPLMQEGSAIGMIRVTRREPGTFAEHHVAMLKTFADQAVIAISNVNLFEQVQQRTRELTESLQQQTATADVLQVISSSPGELAPVFEKMLENATRVCGAEFGSMNLVENGLLRQAALFNVPAEFAAIRQNKIFEPHPRSSLAAAIRTKQVVHTADLRTIEAYLERAPATVEIVELGGARTAVIVPMLRDEEVIGAITIYRNEVRLFTDKQIELVSNFAKQAVIAIENARLLKELRQRTDDLSKSLNDLRTAQDRLVQTEKLASLGQLTAGIAHEIKNPLNFVNNFAALSAELTGELKDVLKQAEVGEKIRTEVDELTALLRDNLDKVVQHGKRADSIVKNMLLHSREGSREQRPADVNTLVDESLNLAYHGARAEKSGFEITLQRDFDVNAGTVDLFPQEISRALLNLLSNGFYAATKRKAESGGAGAEPTVLATTKDLGSSVEIRIRDNGAGVPSEVREKMFNPFFTTKPTGEGTGLGLSMTHDIIVKQHGGRIDVETEPGVFTEFIITLPRKVSGPP